jgi:hypothetical protein
LVPLASDRANAKPTLPKRASFTKTCAPYSSNKANEAATAAGPQLAGETALCCHGRLPDGLQSCLGLDVSFNMPDQ